MKPRRLAKDIILRKAASKAPSSELDWLAGEYPGIIVVNEDPAEGAFSSTLVGAMSDVEFFDAGQDADANRSLTMTTGARLALVNKFIELLMFSGVHNGKYKIMDPIAMRILQEEAQFEDMANIRESQDIRVKDKAFSHNGLYIRALKDGIQIWFI